MATVLVVDDSKLARMAMAKSVNTAWPDWTCIEAANAADALAVAQLAAPQVALIDYNMPDRNGLELLADLRSLDPKMAVAIISANSQREVVEGARALGAAFIPKPLKREDLAAFLSACNFG
jgi:DNA-binding NarL/FixJ family response regulator